MQQQNETVQEIAAVAGRLSYARQLQLQINKIEIKPQKREKKNIKNIK